MSARTLILPVLIASLIAATASPARDARPTAPPPRAKRLTEAEVRRLIDRLASEDFAEREAATEALKRRPEAAVYLLRASRTATSPEVQRRLQSILPVMMSREGAEKRLARLPEYTKHRQVDRFVETMVACREFLTPEHDPLVWALVNDIYTAATGGKEHSGTAEKLADFKALPWHDTSWKSITSIGLVGRPANGIIAADRIAGNCGIQLGVALCNGDVDIPRDAMHRSILIATGKVRFHHIEASVVVSPVGVVAYGGGGGSLVVTAGRVFAFGNGETDALPWPADHRTTIRERDQKFFSTWELYLAAEAGPRLWSIFGVVGVRTVAPGSRFDRAGIEPGDIMAQIDNTPVRSIRDANRLLCRATVSWGATDLTLFRGGNRYEVIVPLCEW